MEISYKKLWKIFIDCMCNSGLYHDENGVPVEGTPIRVEVLRDAVGQYRQRSNRGINE